MSADAASGIRLELDLTSQLEETRKFLPKLILTLCTLAANAETSEERAAFGNAANAAEKLLQALEVAPSTVVVNAGGAIWD